jgi:rhamnosyltransferase
MNKKPLPKFAVMLAAHNGVNWIEEQIKSILIQEKVDVTIFISVDLSTDGTELLIDSIACNKKKLNVLAHGKSFGSATKNFFRLLKEVDFSGYDYIALSDQDDIWLPLKLHNAYKLMISNSAESYSSDFIAFWSNGVQKHFKKSYPQVKYDHFFESPGPGCSFVFTNKFTKLIKLTILSNLHDIDLLGPGQHDWFIYALCRSNSLKWVIDDQALLLYRQHDSNLFGVNHGFDAYINRFNKILSGWWISQALMISKLVNEGGNVLFFSQIEKNRMLYLKLALRSFACRRKPTDKLFFFFICLLMFILGTKLNDGNPPLLQGSQK